MMGRIAALADDAVVLETPLQMEIKLFIHKIAYETHATQCNANARTRTRTHARVAIVPCCVPSAQSRFVLVVLAFASYPCVLACDACSAFAISMGIIFFCIGIGIGREWIENLVFAIGIIAANVPEGLLSTVTVALTITAKRIIGRQERARQEPRGRRDARIRIVHLQRQDWNAHDHHERHDR
jgi:hypothetical protein